MQVIIGLAVVGLLGGVVYLLKQISDQQLQIIRRIEILELTAAGEGGRAVERADAKRPEKGLLIGSHAPEFVLPDLNGKDVTFKDLLAKGKPLLFFFVSPNCNPCGALLPEIETWQGELKEKLNFVFISSGQAKENAGKFEGKTFKQLLLQKDREVAERFGALWTPAALLINPDGKVASHVAAGDAGIRELVEKIKAADSGAKSLWLISNGNGEEKTKLGENVPEFSLEDVAGKPVTSEDLRGKKTLVTFWSVNCGFCTQMLEDLRRWDKTKGQDEPDLLVLSSGDKEKNLELDLQSPIVLDQDRKVAEKLGMAGTPSAVLINEDGKIVSEVAVGAEQIWTLIGKRK